MRQTTIVNRNVGRRLIASPDVNVGMTFCCSVEGVPAYTIAIARGILTGMTAAMEANVAEYLRSTATATITSMEIMIGSIFDQSTAGITVPFITRNKRCSSQRLK